jgi:hypothetical protein
LAVILIPTVRPWKRAARKTGQAFSALGNTERMNETKLCGSLLTFLFRSGQAAETPDIIDISRGCGASVLAVLRALSVLDRAGLADARRCRLSLSGLALAAAFNESGPTAIALERPSGRPSSRARHAA